MIQVTTFTNKQTNPYKANKKENIEHYKRTQTTTNNAYEQHVNATYKKSKNKKNWLFYRKTGKNYWEYEPKKKTTN